jgi:hypothetical protein
MVSPSRLASRASLFIRGIEVTGEQLVHGEHVNLVLLEHGVHFLVTPDLTLVVGILQVTLLDICPDLLDSLWP